MPVIEVVGDLLESDCDVIAHGVNCQGVMASGIAKQIRAKWPHVFKDYHETWLHAKGRLLGTICWSYTGSELEEGVEAVVHCFTQKYYGRQTKQYVSYAGLALAMRELERETWAYEKVGIPRIGCGLGGGDWDVVKSILEDIFVDRDIYVYTLEE